MIRDYRLLINAWFFVLPAPHRVHTFRCHELLCCRLAKTLFLAPCNTIPPILFFPCCVAHVLPVMSRPLSPQLGIKVWFFKVTSDFTGGSKWPRIGSPTFLDISLTFKSGTVLVQVLLARRETLAQFLYPQFRKKFRSIYSF